MSPLQTSISTDATQFSLTQEDRNCPAESCDKIAHVCGYEIISSHVERGVSVAVFKILFCQWQRTAAYHICRLHFDIITVPTFLSAAVCFVLSLAWIKPQMEIKRLFASTVFKSDVIWLRYNRIRLSPLSFYPRQRLALEVKTSSQRAVAIYVKNCASHFAWLNFSSCDKCISAGNQSPTPFRLSRAIDVFLFTLRYHL